MIYLELYSFFVRYVFIEYVRVFWRGLVVLVEIVEFIGRVCIF